MNTCGTCKFLGKAVTDWDDEFNDIIPTGFHKCELLTLKRKQQKLPQPLAYAQDGSDYMAALCVKSEFGCIEWQPATPSEKQT